MNEEMTDVPPLVTTSRGRFTMLLSVEEVRLMDLLAGVAAGVVETATERAGTADRSIVDLVVSMRHLADGEGIAWSGVQGWAEHSYYAITRGESLYGPRTRSMRVTPDQLPSSAIHYARAPEDVRVENFRRADRARTAIERYDTSDCEEGLTDLLTGLRLLVERHPSMIWPELAVRAEVSYHAQLRGEEGPA